MQNIQRLHESKMSYAAEKVQDISEVEKRRVFPGDGDACATVAVCLLAAPVLLGRFYTTTAQLMCVTTLLWATLVKEEVFQRLPSCGCLLFLWLFLTDFRWSRSVVIIL